MTLKRKHILIVLKVLSFDPVLIIDRGAKYFDLFKEDFSFY